MVEDLRIRMVHSGDGEVTTCREWPQIVRIREIVFIQGQDCPVEEEFDGLDDGAVQFLAELAGRPVGTFRWRRVEDSSGRPVAKLERFAVLDEFRGKGLGRALVQAAIEHARDAGFTFLAMHAQSHLEAFYRSFGFETVGEPFDEAGIVHVKMVASFPPRP